MKTKEILKEWKTFLNENRIIPLKELTSLMSQLEKYSDDDITNFTDAWNSKQHYSKYSQVILNDLKKGEPVDHILSTIDSHYSKLYQTSGPHIKEKIGSGSISVDDLRKYLDEKSSFNSNEIREQCSYKNGRPVVGSYQDFDVVYSESDWIVIEPKTTIGSISWAHGKPDGSEEKDQKRRVGWCTATTSSNNMFRNYAGNLHMFYCIKSQYESDMSPNRRLCLSFRVEDGKAVLQFESGATVDASNIDLNLKLVKNLIGVSIFEKLNKLVSSRKETNFAEIYRKASLSQILRIVKQLKSQGTEESLIKGEIKNYTAFTDKKEVLFHFLNDESTDVKLTVAVKKDLLEVDPSGVIFRKLVNDENLWVRCNIALREDLLEVDPSGDVIRKLANDESRRVRMRIAQREDLLKADPSGKIIKKLANDEDNSVRSDIVKNAIVKRKDLLEIDPSGDIIRKLANDEVGYIRGFIAKRKELLEVDPSGDIIRKLANDENSWVRCNIAKRKDLLEADPSGDIIRKLANDEEGIIRSALHNSNPDYSSILQTEMILRKYISLVMS